MTDLHSLIEAAITARQERARAATPGPWAIWRDLDHQGFFTVGDEAGVIPEGEVFVEGDVNPTAHVYVEPDAHHIAAEDPAAVLRHCERDLKVLQRHQQATIGGAPLAMHDECRCIAPWPCDEIRDLAAAYAIDIEETP